MSNDITVTLSGFVGTTPKLYETTSGNDFTSFRIASTRRYLDRTRGEWVDGRTVWFTVKAWKGFARNVAASLRRGDAVVVTGRLSVDEWVGPEGPRSSLVVEATSVGPDLARGQAQFTPTVHRRELTDQGAVPPSGADRTTAGGAPGREGDAPSGTGPDAGRDGVPDGEGLATDDPWAVREDDGRGEEPEDGGDGMFDGVEDPELAGTPA